MPSNDLPFEQFFTEKIKERGVSLKKLSEMTGIAPSHIESLVRGDYENMPSAPYFHGYMIHLGEALNFDGEEWWAKLKAEGVIKNSGALDTLPRNRFTKQSPPKYLWAVAVAAVVLIYLGFQLPHILGKPALTVTLPDQNPYTTSSSTFTLEGTVQNADSLYLNGNQQITIAPDGSWQQTVLLGSGLNTFVISAKKFLGGETDTNETIYYTGGNPAATGTSSTNSGTSTAPQTAPGGSSSSSPSSSAPRL